MKAEFETQVEEEAELNERIKENLSRIKILNHDFKDDKISWLKGSRHEIKVYSNQVIKEIKNDHGSDKWLWNIRS